MENKSLFSESVTETLNVLADKFGVKVEELFNVYKKEAKIQLWKNIISLIFSFVFLAGFAYLLNYIYVDVSSCNALSFVKQILYSVVVVAGIILLCFVVATICEKVSETITLIFNPKVWVIEEITSLIQ